jgi:hypothetical protein
MADGTGLCPNIDGSVCDPLLTAGNHGLFHAFDFEVARVYQLFRSQELRNGFTSQHPKPSGTTKTHFPCELKCFM